MQQPTRGMVRSAPVDTTNKSSTLKKYKSENLKGKILGGLGIAAGIAATVLTGGAAAAAIPYLTGASMLVGWLVEREASKKVLLPRWPLHRTPQKQCGLHNGFKVRERLF